MLNTLCESLRRVFHLAPTRVDGFDCALRERFRHILPGEMLRTQNSHECVAGGKNRVVASDTDYLRFCFQLNEQFLVLCRPICVGVSESDAICDVKSSKRKEVMKERKEGEIATGTGARERA